MLTPTGLSQAMNTSILLTGFTKAFISCTVGVKMVGYVMMTYGIVSAVSAMVFGHVARFTGRKPLMGLTFTVDIVTLVSLLLWKPVPTQDYLLFIIPCIWAVGDGIWMSQITSLVAIAFPRTQPAVFSNLATCGSVGFTFILASDQLLCMSSKLYVAISLWGLGVVGYILLERTLFRDAETGSTIGYQQVVEENSDENMEFDRSMPLQTIDEGSEEEN